MAIGSLKTEADLERFIADQLENLPQSTIQGLPDALGARTCEQVAASETFELPEGEPVEIPGCEYVVPVNMTALLLFNFDFEGPALGFLYINGEKNQPSANKIGSTSRFMAGNWMTRVLKKGDVLELRAQAFIGAASAYKEDTNLTILRLT